MPFRLMAVGDVFLKAREDGLDPFLFVKNELANADAVFCNLEAALTDTNAAALEKAVCLRARPSDAAWLREAGIGLVALANNHLLDYGATGFFDTLTTLDRHGIDYFGAGPSREDALREVVLSDGGVRIGLLAFGYGARTDPGCCYQAPLEQKVIVQRLAEVKDKVDFVVVSLHWGLENVPYPSPEQQQLARLLIDAGTAVVLGHHPHVLQGVERHPGGLILYSLGNFNFHQFDIGNSHFHDLSCIAVLDFVKGEEVSCSLIPVKLDEEWRPPLVDRYPRGEPVRRTHGLHFGGPIPGNIKAVLAE